MDIDLARHFARVAFRVGRELEDTLALAKRHLPEAEYRDVARDVAGAIHAVQIALLDRAISEVPSLRAEIEASIARHERFL